MKCDHIVGCSHDCEGSTLIYFSNTNTHTMGLIDHRFSFCPDCGEDIRSLVFPHPVPVEESEKSDLEKLFDKVGRDAFYELLRRPSSFITFNSGQTFTREITINPKGDDDRQS